MGSDVGLGDSVVSDLPNLRNGSRWANGAIVDEFGTTVSVFDNGIDQLLEIEKSESGDDCAFVSDVLALLDANNLNTTANELRKLFIDAGQGEHNVLALIDFYQARERESRNKLNDVRDKVSYALLCFKAGDGKYATDALREALKT